MCSFFFSIFFFFNGTAAADHYCTSLSGAATLTDSAAEDSDTFHTNQRHFYSMCYYVMYIFFVFGAL